MKKVLFALSIFLIATSCKKSSDNPIEEPVPESIAKMTLLPPKLSYDPTAVQGDINYNLLGYGYDVSGKIDDASSARVPVIDMVSFAKEKHVEGGLAATYSMNSWDGINAEALALQLSWGLKATEGRKLYGQSIKSFFPDELPFAEKYIYGYYSDIIEYKQLKFFTDNSTLKYLSTSFKSDLQTMTAETLVKKYGTHVLTNISLGARLNIAYQGETVATDRTPVQNAGYDVALNQFFGKFSGRINKIDSNYLRQIKAPKVAFEVLGGDPTKVKITETANGQRVDIKDWSEALSAKSSVFVRAIALVPLTELIDDPARKAEVEKYIESYLTANEVKLSK